MRCLASAKLCEHDIFQIGNVFCCGPSGNVSFTWSNETDVVSLSKTCLSKASAACTEAVLETARASMSAAVSTYVLSQKIVARTARSSDTTTLPANSPVAGVDMGTSHVILLSPPSSRRDIGRRAEVVCHVRSLRIAEANGRKRIWVAAANTRRNLEIGVWFATPFLHIFNRHDQQPRFSQRRRTFIFSSADLRQGCHLR